MERPGPSRREVVSGVLALCTVAGVPPAVAAGDELRFGLTPVFLTSDLELLDRLRSYLEHATGFPVRLVTRRTYQEITSLLLSGQLDAAWICGFPFVANQPRLALVAVPVWQRQAPLPLLPHHRTGSGSGLPRRPAGRRPRLLGSGQQLRLARHRDGPRREGTDARNGSSAARSSPTGTATSSGPWPPGSR